MVRTNLEVYEVTQRQLDDLHLSYTELDEDGVIYPGMGDYFLVGAYAAFNYGEDLVYARTLTCFDSEEEALEYAEYRNGVELSDAASGKFRYVVEYEVWHLVPEMLVLREDHIDVDTISDIIDAEEAGLVDDAYMSSAWSVEITTYEHQTVIPFSLCAACGATQCVMQVCRYADIVTDGYEVLNMHYVLLDFYRPVSLSYVEVSLETGFDWPRYLGVGHIEACSDFLGERARMRMSGLPRYEFPEHEPDPFEFLRLHREVGRISRSVEGEVYDECIPF